MLRIILALLLSVPAAISQELRVTAGVADDQVLQRGPSGGADMPFGGTAKDADGRTVEARLLRQFVTLEGFDWKAVSTIAQGSWSGALKNIPTGGPYQLELRIAGTDAGATIQNVMGCVNARRTRVVSLATAS